MPRKRTVHVATGADSSDIRNHCVRHHGVKEADVVFHLAQCLSFLLQGSDATTLSAHYNIPKNRFAIRKLKSTLRMLNEVFDDGGE